MDLHARRSNIRTASNPESRLDYLVSLEGSVANLKVRVRYVPDETILLPGSFTEYLDVFADGATHVEAVASTILHDLNNELVARWVQVSVSSAGEFTPSHRATIEDRQPKWDNPGLLARIAVD
jgi:7-cyano-7-deazaguanine reductase